MSEGPDLHTQAALRHEQAANNHDRLPRSGIGQGKRTQAGLQRQLADFERPGAELEREWAKATDPTLAGWPESAAEQARNVTKKHAEHLSFQLNRAAEQLERTATLAEQHAGRHEQAGRSEDAAEEFRAADRAREYAQRARTQAERWLKVATRSPL